MKTDKKPSSLILLSGGLDSSVNFYLAAKKTSIKMVLTFDYGQRSAVRELESARQQVEFLRRHPEFSSGFASDFRFEVVDLRWFKQFHSSALLNESETVPTAGAVSIDDLGVSQVTAKAVWVPNRNGIFLNIAAGFAESVKADIVVPGFNIEEAATFPDNTGEFLQALTRSFAFSTANSVQATCFTTHLNKSEIVKQGQEMGVNFDLIWPCYLGEAKPCGECESCQRLLRAMRVNHLSPSWLVKRF